MSNPTNTVDLSQTFGEFLTAHNALLQQKLDAKGKETPPGGTIRNNGAVIGNFVDDFIMAYMANGNGRLQKLTGLTTDATVGVVIGQVMPEVPDGSQAIIDTKIWGRVGPNDFAYQQTISRVERNGGTLVLYSDLIGTVEYSGGGTLSTAASGHNANGTAVELLVNGEAATNIAWEAHTTVIVAHG